MLALVVTVAATMAAHPESSTQKTLTRLLDRTVWVDIGVGRSLGAMTPAQITELRKCRDFTMAFERTSDGWVQSFYAGIQMRTVYSAAVLKKDASGTAILFYAAGHPEPEETLRTIPGGILIEQTRGFRPRTFLKCDPPKPAAQKQPS